MDKKGTVGRFVNELKNSFVRDAAEAEKKGLDIQEGRNKGKFRQLGNVGLLSGNVLKYGRIVADVCGASIADPFRYAMMGGMITARAAEAGKEARFKSDALLEKTQIKDADEAAEEAWRIYDKAGGSATTEGGGMGATAETIKNAYLRQMPKDIQERLEEDPGVALNFMQKMMRKQIELSLRNLGTKIREISYDYSYINNKWTPKKNYAFS